MDGKNRQLPSRIPTDPLLHSLQCLFDAGHRVRECKTQVSIPGFPKRPTGQTGHTCIVQQGISQHLAIAPGVPDIWGNIESAARIAATNTRDAIQSALTSRPRLNSSRTRFTDNWSPQRASMA